MAFLQTDLSTQLATTDTLLFLQERLILRLDVFILHECEDALNPLRPNSDLSQTSHCNIKGLSVGEVMRIENMITQVKFY